MINYNGKLFTLIAIAFLVFLVYQNQHSNTGNTFKDEPQGVIGRYNIEINPNKPESEMSFVERMLLWSFGSKLKSIENNNTVVDKIPQHNESSDKNKSPVKLGDKVLLTVTDIADDKPSEPIMILVGSAMQGKEIDDAIIGLKINDISLVTINNKKYHISILAINPIETDTISKEACGH